MRTENLEELRNFWKKHIYAWQESSTTQVAYCHEHKLHVHRFGYWKRKLIDANIVLSQTNSFVQISTENIKSISPIPTTTLCIQLPNQLRIEGISNNNLGLVKQLVERLQ